MLVKKTCKTLLYLLLCMGIQAHALNYRRIFDDSYTSAERYAEGIRPQLIQIARQYGEDWRLIESIVFPELMRYHKVYDAVETSSLISLYTTLGIRYADFSIGRFQMKPSFAYSVEQFLWEGNYAQLATQLGFKSDDTTDNASNRYQRISRLESTNWQIRYVIGMVQCMRSRHKAYLKKAGNTHVLSFIASGYNSGWYRSAAHIQDYSKKAMYSLSKWPSKKKYCFADIALFRYRELQQRTKYS